MPKLPLEGVVIVDASRVLAGPFCTMMLGDLGAEIIKIENPNGGDETRKYGPFIGDESSYFLSINRNKKSISLDLEDEGDRKKLYDLIGKADVFLHNLTNRSVSKLGIDFETISKYNDRIIYSTISGFGREGPKSDLPGYDILMQGVTGLMSVTGLDENNITRVGNSTVDIYVGYLSAIMILSHLLNRKNNPDFKAVRIDVPLFDSSIYSLTYLLGYFAATGNNPKPLGVAHSGIAPYQKFETADRPIIVAAGNNFSWKRLCVSLGLEHLIDDPRFSTNDRRVRNREELVPIIQRIIAEKPSDYWISKFHKENIPVGEINRISDLLEDEQVKFRKSLFWKDVRGKEMLMASFPAWINGEPLDFYRSDPPEFKQREEK